MRSAAGPAPLEEAAGKAPRAGAVLPRFPLGEEHAPGGVGDGRRRADARVGEEDEAAGGAGRSRPPATCDGDDPAATPRAPGPVVSRRLHASTYMVVARAAHALRAPPCGLAPLASAPAGSAEERAAVHVDHVAGDEA